jgi:glutamate--cysteine ligase
VVENTGQTFRDFMANGFAGERATMGDWLTHLNTMFPEVRLKKTLEMRGCDSLPRDLFTALPALWTGILYDARALDEADALSESFGYDELVELRPRVAREGVGASFRGHPAADVGSRLIEIARGGLERRARLDALGRHEGRFLEPLAALISSRRSPADRLVDAHRRPTWSERLAAAQL